MDKIIPAFETTLLDPTLSDACLEIGELGIDSLLDTGTFQGIPIVGMLVGLGKTAQNIHDRNLLKQTVKFINTFNDGSIPRETLEKKRAQLAVDSKFAEEELGRVLILLNANVDLSKSELLAKFYKAYVSEEIDWPTFCECSDIISRMFVSDLALLKGIAEHKVTDTTQCKHYQAERLIPLGLLDSSMKSTIITNGKGKSTLYISTNELGNLFCKIAFSM